MQKKTTAVYMWITRWIWWIFGENDSKKVTRKSVFPQKESSEGQNLTQSVNRGTGLTPADRLSESESIGIGIYRNLLELESIWKKKASRHPVSEFPEIFEMDKIDVDI